MKQEKQGAGRKTANPYLCGLLCAVMCRLIHDIHRENPRENRIIRRCDSFGERTEPIIQMVIFLWLIILCTCHANDQTWRLRRWSANSILCASESSAILMTPINLRSWDRLTVTPEMCEICHCGETLAQAAKAPRQMSAPVYHELGA